MAFPPQFQYANEEAFIQGFLIPLLQRLGFSLVFNYHGSSEFGKDLIFGEIDRFGHVRYHGLQAKYEASISLNEVESLVLDCKQAFASPFTHPQNGTVERISSFYAVNGGSLGTEAVNHYFNSLRPMFGGNVQLLQGRDLLALDRWASVNRVNSVGEQVTGLLIELRYNRWMISHLTAELPKDPKNRPLERLRLDAVSAYLRGPSLSGSFSTEDASNYWHIGVSANRILDFTSTSMSPEQNRTDLTKLILDTLFPALGKLADGIEAALLVALSSLGPLSGV